MLLYGTNPLNRLKLDNRKLAGALRFRPSGFLPFAFLIARRKRLRLRKKEKIRLFAGLAQSRKDFYCLPNMIRYNKDGPDVQVSAVLDLSLIINFCFVELETNVNNVKLR